MSLPALTTERAVLGRVVCQRSTPIKQGVIVEVRPEKTIIVRWKDGSETAQRTWEVEDLDRYIDTLRSKVDKFSRKRFELVGRDEPV